MDKGMDGKMETGLEELAELVLLEPEPNLPEAFPELLRVDRTAAGAGKRERGRGRGGSSCLSGASGGEDVCLCLWSGSMTAKTRPRQWGTLSTSERPRGMRGGKGRGGSGRGPVGCIPNESILDHAGNRHQFHF